MTHIKSKIPTHTWPKDALPIFILGDSTKALKRLPDNFAQVVVTSPPYWGVRDYGVNGQIGNERTLDSYIKRLTKTFDEVRRILRTDGVMWLNVGDVYSSGDRTYRAADPKSQHRAMDSRPATPPGLKAKDLLAIPWRLSLALQAAGWYLRTEIIWNKTNSMPESVGDRPMRSHEYLFLFSKSKRYFFNKDGLKDGKKRLRSVWSIPNDGQGNGHPAIFPARLITPCILSSSEEGDIVLDPFCGTGTVALVSSRMKRRSLGIELNKQFLKIGKKRIRKIRQIDMHRLAIELRTSAII